MTWQGKGIGVVIAKAADRAVYDVLSNSNFQAAIR
jgi:hypothetical protein